MNIASYQVHTGESALERVRDAGFRSRWERLYASCPWATSMQSPGFVLAWYSRYMKRYNPVIVEAVDSEKELNGLMLLAIRHNTKTIVPAGDNFCEYPTWLALDQATGDEFFPEALSKLEREVSADQITLLFTASDTPLGWLEGGSKWGRLSYVRKEEKPIIDLNDEAPILGSLRKKHNRSRLNQMERIGKVEFVTFETVQEFDELYDQIERLEKLRLSATHGVPPIRDPDKKLFFRDLFLEGLLFGTLLKVGDKIASAHLDLFNRDSCLLGMTAFSPYFARFSPNKFHISLLALKLHSKGVRTLDLTPGGNYKDRYATSYEDLHSLTIFFNLATYYKFIAKRKALGLGAELMERSGVSKDKARKLMNRIEHSLRNSDKREIKSKLLRQLRLKRKARREMRIYAMQAEPARALNKAPSMKMDCIDDLLLYEPAESWQLSRTDFHLMAFERLGKNNHVFTKVENGKLIHCGWLVERQETSYISEVEQYFDLPQNSAVLFDFFTHPVARGKGVYKASMSHMLNYAASLEGTHQIYICVLAENVPSRRAIESVGFEYKSSLYG